MFLGLTVPIYNSWLNMYYLLSIRYNISSERFSKYEYGLHGIAILLPFSVAIMSTIDKSRGAFCVAQGKVAFWTYTLIIYFSFLICIVSMLCICLTVILQARKTRKYTNFNTNADIQTRRERGFEKTKRKIIKQACLYALAFALTYSTPFIIFLFYGSKLAETQHAHWSRIGKKKENSIKSFFSCVLCVEDVMGRFWKG